MIRMKKTLKIILIVAIVVILGLLGWFWLFPGSSEPVADKVRDFLPFGTGEGVNIPPGDEQSTIDNGQGGQSEPEVKLFQVSKEPVAGFIAFSKGATTTIRFVDRATGHIYDMNPLTQEKTKVTNKTLPKIYEAYFRDNGNSVLFRSLVNDSDMVENLSLALTPPKIISTTTDNLYTVLAVNLRGDIKEVAVGSGDSLFYVAEDSSSIISSTFNGTNLRTLFNSSFTDWRLVPYGNNLMIYTRVSSDIPGYAYRLNSNGALTKILGPLNGLTVTPNSSGGFAYSYNNEGSLKLVAKEDSASEEVDLPPTFAEKCVWSSEKEWIIYCAIPTQNINGKDIDNWYKGISHFSDKVWYFDTRVNISEVLVESDKNLGFDLDAIHLEISPNEDYLVFMNKNDLSLWALKLER